MKDHAGIAALLKETMGLEIATVGEAALRHAVRSRMSSCGIMDIGAYWNRLRGSPIELQELIEAIVVPETWFFRDPDAFSALAKIVTSEWLTVQPHRSLRILSVPCSTGEEPYSIAMALLDAGVSPEAFTIDAIDISARSLAIARSGVFRRNSFRGGDVSFRDRYFRSSIQGAEILPAVGLRVRFQQGNLLSSDFGSRADLYDVIFCRNVLIYFDAPTQQQVVSSLSRLLAPEGLLFVGPAEAFLVRDGGFVSANEPRAFAYRKARATRAPVRSIAPPVSRKFAPRPRIKAQPRPVPVVPPLGDALETARRLADSGKLDEATEICETHLREHGASSAALYLLGLLRDASGDVRGAADCYRKVLYLDPNHTDALTHLALLEEKRGARASARRLQLRAQRIEKSVST